MIENLFSEADLAAMRRSGLEQQRQALEAFRAIGAMVLAASRDAAALGGVFAAVVMTGAPPARAFIKSNLVH